LPAHLDVARYATAPNLTPATFSPPTSSLTVICNREFWRQCSPIFVAATVVVYVLAPSVYVWGGYPCGSVRAHAIDRLFTQPFVSRWNKLDYFRPFAYDV
jgi:hypothetical protein